MHVLGAAKDYVARGWPVVPVAKGSKRPLVSWKDLQSRLNTTDEIQHAFSQNGVNVSIVTGAFSGLVVLDADTEHGKSELEKHLPENLETPICRTARGWHYYFKHPGGKVPSKPLIEGHLDVKADGGLVAAPPSEGKQWVISPDDVEPAPMPQSILTFIKELNYYSYKASDVTSCQLAPLQFQKGSRDNSLFTVAKILRKGGATQEQALQLLEMLGQCCQPPYPQKDITTKVLSTYRHAEAENQSLAERIREWALMTPGDFKVTEADCELGIVTPSDKNNRTKILGRLVDEGIIERGRKRGEYRVINRDEQVIDWMNADAGDGLPIRWPLELENRFEVMPGSVVVVAGESNAGKTAFLLNVARMNLDTMPTTYFSSSNETNARVLKKRLAAFGEPLEVWSKLKTISRSGDFQDVIRPDGLNLVDYLEVHQDFYEIGGKIAAIAEKLKDGVAVVALQKNPGSDWGRGGAMTLDKATAYFSLHRGDLDKPEPHTLKLPKVKYPLVDYADKPIRFKLAGGVPIH